MRFSSLKNSSPAMERRQALYRAVSYIPKGKVSTYARIGEVAGITNPRLVGTFLHQNPDPLAIPCHRVVTNSGAVASAYAFGGASAQKQKLVEEGALFKQNRVDMRQCLWKPSKALRLYFILLNRFGEPGTWPWFGNKAPHTPEEIIISAVLTQNTNWKNAERAIENLRLSKAATIKKIYALGRQDMPALKQLIRPAGFYNQKAQYLCNLAAVITERFGSIRHLFSQPTLQAREILLGVKGIGKETADTILLYAGNKAVFVIDAYTKRFAQIFLLSAERSYDGLQQHFIRTLPQNAQLYKDYHALIVRWGKESRVTGAVNKNSIQ